MVTSGIYYSYRTLGTTPTWGLLRRTRGQEQGNFVSRNIRVRTIPDVGTNIFSQGRRVRKRSVSVFSGIILRRAVPRNFRTQPFLYSRQKGSGSNNHFQTMGLPSFFSSNRISLGDHPSRTFLCSRVISSQVRSSSSKHRQTYRTIVRTPRRITHNLTPNSRIRTSREKGPNFPKVFPFFRPRFRNKKARRRRKNVKVRPNVTFILPIFFRRNTLFQKVKGKVSDRVMTMNIFNTPSNTWYNQGNWGGGRSANLGFF